MAERPRTARCPVCGKASAEAVRPFCSPRCRQVDLGRWLTGAYAIPAADKPEDEDGEVWTGDRG
jgi:endogenous inhibitor of DNA gyrase (YacG/DUF329 family)